MKHTKKTRWLITLGAAGALLLGACTGGDTEGADETTTATATQMATATVTSTATQVPAETAMPETSPTRDSSAPTTGQPPSLEATSAGASVAAGLGSYCWTTSTSGGHPGICADAIGIVTGSEALTTAPGAEVVLESAEQDGLAGATAVNVQLWSRDALGEPAAAGDWGVAWNPGEAQATVIEGTLADGAITFTAPAEPGAYIVGLFVTFENGDAMYGLQVEVE